MKRSRNDQPSYRIQLRQAIAAYLPTRGLPLIGSGRWTDRLLVIAAILLTFVAGTSMLDRFAGARAAVVAMYRSRRRPGASFNGFMGVLTRRSPRLLALVVGVMRQRMQENLAAHWRIGQFVVFGFDGSMIDCPRTKANEKHFKNGDQSGPQMLLGMLFHVRTGLIWAWRRADARTAERTLLRDMLGDLPTNALLLADAGLTGYGLWSEIMAAGHYFLIRVGANVRLLKKLGYAVEERHGTVYLWPDRAQRRLGLPPLVLRLITLQNGRNRKMCLLTNVPAEELSDAEAQSLYRLRWGVELLFRAMKQTLTRRKMLSDSPRHAEVELDWSVMGQWMLSLLLFEHRREKSGAQAGATASVQQGFAAALRIVRDAMAGRVDRRSSFWRRLATIRRDRYQRRRPKKARAWPHKKNQTPCGLPEVRMATREEIRMAIGFRQLKRAA